jgi:small-conductance mechanosensitive channel
MIRTIRKYFILRKLDEKGDKQMSKTAKWVIGIVVAIVILQFVTPFLWQLIFPGTFAGHGMMGRGYGMHMPMMGFGFMPFGMIFMWLIPLSILVLIALGIVWLAKQLTTKSS